MAGITAAPPAQLATSTITASAGAESPGTGAGGADGRGTPSPDVLRLKFGALIILAAFALLGLVFAVAITHFSTGADVTAVVGSVATVVGTIIGAYLGVQVGSHGRDAATAARDRAEQTTRAALAALPPQEATQVLRSS
jgi:hypothetical protein